MNIEKSRFAVPHVPPGLGARTGRRERQAAEGEQGPVLEPGEREIRDQRSTLKNKRSKINL